jgi:hypothetical protein
MKVDMPPRKKVYSLVLEISEEEVQQLVKESDLIYNVGPALQVFENLVGHIRRVTDV